MRLFKKEKTPEEEKIDELCGGFIINDYFRKKLIENNLYKNETNLNYKNILKSEINSKKLNYEDIETRLDELLKLDVSALNNKIRINKKLDTSTFHTQEDINFNLGEEYTKKFNEKKFKDLQKLEEKEEKRLEKIQKNKLKQAEKEEKIQKQIELQNKILDEGIENVSQKILQRGLTVEFPKISYEASLGNIAAGGMILGKTGALMGAMVREEKTNYVKKHLTLNETGICIDEMFILYENIVNVRDERNFIINDKFGNNYSFIIEEQFASMALYQILKEKLQK